MDFLYSKLIKPILFFLSAEQAHFFGMLGVRLIGFFHRLHLWPRPSWAKQKQIQTPFGLLDSPLGLAAGFDKNANCLWGWQALGFSFVEVGTITPLSQGGNPKPRLFRYPEIKSLVNRMGFNNNGVHVIANRIRRAKKAGLKIRVGGNIGKNFITTTENASRDYILAAIALKDVVDYLVINVSSPNTPGLRSLQNENFLSEIVKPVKTAIGNLPLFIKVAPDDFKNFIDGIESVVKKFNLSGVICGNTLAGHSYEKGGLSGDAIFKSNLELCQSYAARVPFVIGVGGISNGATADAYIKAGAKVIQIYSALVYQGPQLIKTIVKSL